MKKVKNTLITSLVTVILIVIVSQFTDMVTVGPIGDKRVEAYLSTRQAFSKRLISSCSTYQANQRRINEDNEEFLTANFNKANGHDEWLAEFNEEVADYKNRVELAATEAGYEN